MTGEFRLRGAIERVDRSSGRFYVWQGNRFWSVTTITGVVPKPWLGPWTKKITAQYAVDHLELLGAMVADVGPDDTAKWLKGAADAVRDKAADKGTAIHAAAEQLALGIPRAEWTDLEAPYMEGLANWIADWDVVFEAIEAPVFSRQHWYAGCLDCIVVLFGGDGPRLLVDYKTGKKVYAETALQLAGYRHSETFIGLPDGDEDPTPEVDGAAVLRLDPELARGYEFVPIRTDRPIFDMFLYVREMFRWQEETSKTVVGRRANPAHPVCVQEMCGHSALLHPKQGCSALLEPTPAQARNLVALPTGEFQCACPSYRATPLKRPVTVKAKPTTRRKPAARKPKAVK